MVSCWTSMPESLGVYSFSWEPQFSLLPPSFPGVAPLVDSSHLLPTVLALKGRKALVPVDPNTLVSTCNLSPRASFCGLALVHPHLWHCLAGCGMVLPTYSRPQALETAQAACGPPLVPTVAAVQSPGPQDAVQGAAHPLLISTLPARRKMQQLISSLLLCVSLGLLGEDRLHRNRKLSRPVFEE